MSFPPVVPDALPNTLGDIIAKVRRITKSPSQNQITDLQIIQYVNTYYLYDFPAELRLKNMLTNWNFTTTPNQETYKLPTDTIITIEPPIYIDGYQSFFTQSQEKFYQLYPKLGLTSMPVSGSGVTNYAFTVSGSPILQNNFVIGAMDSAGNSAYANDVPVTTSTGTLSGPFVTSGTINYLTGAVTIVFTNTIPSGNQITVDIVPYVPSRPSAALFYYDTVYLRPIPDNFYLVNIAAYVNPFAVTAAGVNQPAGGGFANSTPTTGFTSDTPQIKQWWQLIAWGTAIKIFEDRGDVENMARIIPSYEQQKLLALRRTIVQQSSERVATIYSDQNQAWGGYGGWFQQG